MDKSVEMQSVESSNIMEVGYSEIRKMLFVRFKGGGLYVYNDVPENIFKSLVTAGSVGKYLSSTIKGVYDYKKVNDEALMEDVQVDMSKPEPSKERMLFLVDFSWLYYSSKFALKDLTHEIDGVPYGTGTIHGVYNALSAIFHYFPNSRVLLCMDGEPLKQKLLNQDYKGSREHKKDVDTVQLGKFEVAKPFTLVPRISIAYSQSMEADETIAFFVRMKKPEMKTVIFSSDGDLRQLISTENNVFCSTSIRNEGDFVFEDEGFLYKNGPKGLDGLEPRAVPLYLAITGDKSDEIFGIPRFKRALAKKLANEAVVPDRLKSLIRNSNSTKYAKDFQKIEENMDLININYGLVKLDPIAIPSVYSVKDVDPEFFNKYGCVQADQGVKNLIKLQTK